MFIPLGTDRPIRSTTLVSYTLIGINLMVFALQQAAELSDPSRAAALLDWGAASRDNFRWWTLITYAFLHGGWLHILGNSLFLFVFGPNIEDRLGRLWFLLFYLLGGVAAGALQIAFSAGGVIGASGAIAACTGAYLVMFPRTHIKVFSLLFYIGGLNVPAWWFIGGSILWDVLSQGMGRLGPGGGAGIAHLAHLGGYAFGAAVAMGLLWLKLVPREQYDLFTMGRQAYRRRQFKDAANAAERKLMSRADRQKHNAADAAQVEALAHARAEVLRHIAAGDLAAAASAYRTLADTHGHIPNATLLSRKNQYDLASYLYTTGDHNAASFAFERFLDGYPRDPDAAQIKLLLGIITGRSLNDPIKAKRLIAEALPNLDDSSAAMAQKELEALG